jgi:hypothetical protein
MLAVRTIGSTGMRGRIHPTTLMRDLAAGSSLPAYPDRAWWWQISINAGFNSQLDYELNKAARGVTCAKTSLYANAI